MQFTITGKHTNVAESVRAHAEDKASKLPHYYDGVNQVDVLIDGSVRGRVTVEVIARGEHRNVFVATETGEDVYGCIDSAVRKLEKQLTKKKAIQRNHKHTETAEQA